MSCVDVAIVDIDFCFYTVADYFFSVTSEKKGTAHMHHAVCKSNLNIDGLTVDNQFAANRGRIGIYRYDIFQPFTA